MLDEVKDRSFTMRLGAEDFERIERLAAHYALSASSVIRMLLKKADDETRPTPPPEKKTKTRTKK